ncbi:hypothetical protein ACWD5B_38115 [Streptomyces tanashiensis]|uniref:hypothetical protein n=1 Tax=Streptomyces tanashiensis TaxID=67367 RepID=UPI0036AE5F39
MRWTALISKIVVAGAAGAFLAVSAAGVEPPRQASDADPGREVPAEQRRSDPEPGAEKSPTDPGTDTEKSPTDPGAGAEESPTDPAPERGGATRGAAGAVPGPSRTAGQLSP